jgi:hypothetical protein
MDGGEGILEPVSVLERVCCFDFTFIRRAYRIRSATQHDAAQTQALA